MAEISISARIIRWPPACACCAGDANKTVDTYAVRVTGKRVISTQWKSWPVPYCNQCISHREAWAYYESLKYPSAPFAWHVVILIIFIVLAVAWIIVLFASLVDSKRSPFVCCMCPAILFTPFVAALGGGYFWTAAAHKTAVVKHRSDIKRIRKLKDAALADAERLGTRNCAATGEAITYHGWHGTVHQFTFSSGRYADLFAKENAGKIVGLKW